MAVVLAGGVSQKEAQHPMKKAGLRFAYRNPAHAHPSLLKPPYSRENHMTIRKLDAVPMDLVIA
jgi:hypothetical protein